MELRGTAKRKVKWAGSEKHWVKPSIIMAKRKKGESELGY
jgi:hypothetical protein